MCPPTSVVAGHWTLGESVRQRVVRFGATLAGRGVDRLKSRSTGAPEPDDAAVVDTGTAPSRRGSWDDGDDSPPRASCAFRLADASAEAAFAKLLRERCVAVYWALILAARCGEVCRLAPTGVGGGVLDRLLTAALVAATAAFAAAPASKRRAWVDRSPRIILGHVLVKYAIRLWRVGHFAETYDVDGEVRRIYEFLDSDANLVYTVVAGVALPLICGASLRFQALFVGLNAACGLGTASLVGPDVPRIARAFALWLGAVGGGNGLVFGVLKPLWLSGAVSTSRGDLQRRVDQLANEKERITWEWQLDAMRNRERKKPESDAASSSSDAAHDDAASQRSTKSPGGALFRRLWPGALLTPALPDLSPDLVDRVV